MRAYQKESGRLNRVEVLVRSRFPRFGVNKKREIIRLLYEIAKREDIDPEVILSGSQPKKFGLLKDYLLKRRFPGAAPDYAKSRFYLPALGFNVESVSQIASKPFRPLQIYAEAAVAGHHLVEQFRKTFPGAAFNIISTLKQYVAGRQKLRIVDYNQRGESVFITQAGHDFFKRCPCTRDAVSCGYHIFNLSFGCIYECTYCYLQEYANTPGLIFPANVECFFDRWAAYRQAPETRSWQKGPFLRIGTGEFSDSLMLDEVTEYSLPIIEHFRKHPDVLFEFKTKSSNVKNLLRARPTGNIVVAWSLNPSSIIATNEFYTAGLEARLAAARRCHQAGYRLAFHFDPVFYFAGWKEEYEQVIEQLFSTVKVEAIDWISIGTLRFKPELKPVIEKRFPENTILDEELILGYDNKLRYPRRLRYTIYKKLIEKMLHYSAKLPIYLCMEDERMWKDLKLPFPFT